MNNILVENKVYSIYSVNDCRSFVVLEMKENVKKYSKCLHLNVQDFMSKSFLGKAIKLEMVQYI